MKFKSRFRACNSALRLSPCRSVRPSLWRSSVSRVAPCYGISPEQPALNNKIGPFYQDTEEFAGELQKYLKVAKVCDGEHLADCRGYDKTDVNTNEPFNVKDIKDGEYFGMPETSTSDFTGDTMGLVTIDGTPVILAWNKKCEMLEPGVYQWSGNTNISTSCVAAIMDVNGTKRPDKSGKDIVLLNASNVGICIKFTISGKTYKWGCPFVPTPLTYSQCDNLKKAGKINACAASSSTLRTNFDGDRWASAVQTCGGTANMPSLADLIALANYLYNKSNLGASWTGSVTMDTAKLAALNTALNEIYTVGKPFTYAGNGLSEVIGIGYFNLWSGQESSSTHAHYRYFQNKSTGSEPDYRFFGYIWGVCKF